MRLSVIEFIVSCTLLTSPLKNYVGVCHKKMTDLNKGGLRELDICQR